MKADKVRQGMHLFCDEDSQTAEGGEILAAYLTAQQQLLPNDIELAQECSEECTISAASYGST